MNSSDGYVVDGNHHNITAAVAAAECDIPCHERSLSERVQDHPQQIGCQHVQWRISCVEDLASL